MEGPDEMAGRHFELEISRDCRNHQRCLLQCKGRANATARSRAERQIGKSINFLTAAGKEATGIKIVRLIPQESVAMEDVGGYYDDGARFDRPSAKPIGLRCGATDGGKWWIETDRLVDDRSCLHEALNHGL